ncbi:MAG: hypothetical protein JHC55_19405 [Mycolicibacterium sp.]|uniref:hypothetical protein n=1 Tax=Mycolicibacterium arabiense TaxID=1286181 RepID=UPI0013CFFB0A|nr:hypothetical protein [Mycolicibacterium arabiense]MBJ7386650.1 hypothetical protein [Mycolicibacterium sp.]MCV7376729.1 hypothetical protein [Mycolicibacterium arabiense]
MRTAVVRVDVDPSGVLTPAQLGEGMTALSALSPDVGATVVDVDLAAMPPGRRQVEVLLAGDDADHLERVAVELCASVFGALGAQPTAGVLTYVSRGTDHDALGVLAGFGLTGEIEREDGPEWDVVRVTLRKSDLERIPESRVHTALEASLNCEVHIITV